MQYYFIKDYTSKTALTSILIVMLESCTILKNSISKLEANTTVFRAKYTYMIYYVWFMDMHKMLSNNV